MSSCGMCFSLIMFGVSLWDGKCPTEVDGSCFSAANVRKILVSAKVCAYFSWPNVADESAFWRAHFKKRKEIIIIIIIVHAAIQRILMDRVFKKQIGTNWHNVAIRRIVTRQMKLIKLY